MPRIAKDLRDYLSHPVTLLPAPEALDEFAETSRAVTSSAAQPPASILEMLRGKIFTPYLFIPTARRLYPVERFLPHCSGYLFWQIALCWKMLVTLSGHYDNADKPG